MITKRQAVKIAKAAVGGGTVLQAQLEDQVRRPYWSIDVLFPPYEYEVHVDAYTGKVLKIIRQHQ